MGQGSSTFSWPHYFKYSPVMWPDPEVHLEVGIQGLEAPNLACSLPKGQEELMGTSTC